jgi:predicted DNA-binding ribbon-helix-helix protein
MQHSQKSEILKQEVLREVEGHQTSLTTEELVWYDLQKMVRSVLAPQRAREQSKF